MKNLFTGRNISMLIGTLTLIVVGYILLAQGPVDNPLSISVAPVILVISYCVFIPVAIMAKGKGKKENK